MVRKVRPGEGGGGGGLCLLLPCGPATARRRSAAARRASGTPLPRRPVPPAKRNDEAPQTLTPATEPRTLPAGPRPGAHCAGQGGSVAPAGPHHRARQPHRAVRVDALLAAAADGRLQLPSRRCADWRSGRSAAAGSGSTRAPAQGQPTRRSLVRVLASEAAHAPCCAARLRCVAPLEGWSSPLPSSRLLYIPHFPSPSCPCSKDSPPRSREYIIPPTTTSFF